MTSPIDPYNSTALRHCPGAVFSVFFSAGVYFWLIAFLMAWKVVSLI